MVFDCETILDVGLLKKAFGDKLAERGAVLDGDDATSEYELSKMAMEVYAETANTAFLPVCFHQVVSIAAVFCDDFGNFIKVGNFAASGESADEREKSLIAGFFDYLNKHQPRLVSYNGRNFDLPMLLARALKYKLCAYAYFEENNQNYNKSKWENYRQRYCERFHTDLLDSLSGYGAARGLRLDWMANLAGFPGKYDTHGDMVLDLYYASEQARIDSYCQSDVLNTYGLYLGYELLKGNLTREDYARILAAWREKLPEEAEFSEHFSAAILAQLADLEGE